MQVAPQQPLMEAGLDSLAAVELRNQLAAHFNVDLAPTLSFDFPTAAALASHISSKTAEASHDILSVESVLPELSLEEVEEVVSQITAEVMGVTVDRHQVLSLLHALVMHFSLLSF